MATVFVYHKDNKISCYSAEHSYFKLIADGWKHTATLDACKFIENLFNNCDDIDIVAIVKELKNV